MIVSRIIIADDHSLIRIGLVNILKAGFPDVIIKEVEDGDSLLNEVMLHPWDLVISDLNMPGTGGMEILTQIKKLKPHLPVLIISTYLDEHYAVRVLKAGGAGYINKSAAAEELAIAIKQISLGKKYITPENAGKLFDHFDGNIKPHELLTNREFEIFKLLAFGKTVSQIAIQLVSVSSGINNHRRKIMQKMVLSTNAELIQYAIANQLISIT